MVRSYETAISRKTIVIELLIIYEKSNNYRTYLIEK